MKYQSADLLKTLNETRHLATRGGWCYQHVQAVAIDQLDEAATGNRGYFLKASAARTFLRNERGS